MQLTAMEKTQCLQQYYNLKQRSTLFLSPSQLKTYQNHFRWAENSGDGDVTSSAHQGPILKGGGILKI